MSETLQERLNYLGRCCLIHPQPEVAVRDVLFWIDDGQDASEAAVFVGTDGKYWVLDACQDYSGHG